MIPGPPPVMTVMPLPGELRGELLGGRVRRVAGLDARRPEDRHRGPELGQGVEALDELAHDPQGAPRVGVQEGRVGVGL